MTDSKAEDKAVASGSGTNDSKGGNDLLLRFFQSEWFTPALCVTYLERYIDNIGISHYLCNRLAAFPFIDLEFFVPQLCHLLVTHSSPSTALELLLLEAASKSQHVALQMQFIFQNYLTQFALLPSSDKYRICQDMFNRILSAQGGIIEKRFREHIAPASIAVGGIMGAIGVPTILSISAEVASRQARRERIFEVDDTPGPSEIRKTIQRSKSMSLKQAPSISPPISPQDAKTLRAASSASLDVRRPLTSSGTEKNGTQQRSSSATHFSNKHSSLMSHSQPNLQPAQSSPRLRPTSTNLRTISPTTFTDENITRTLKSYYYSTQTQFLQCLQDLSLRLRHVPKQARQSALRIELEGLDKWLPADVCLCNVCHPVNDAHDRVVSIVQSDCTILNSAERVPYLLLVEVLKGDLTFSPSRPRNRKHFRDIMTSNPSSRQFDITSTITTPREKTTHDQWTEELSQLNNSENEDGDLGLQELNEENLLGNNVESPTSPRLDSPNLLPRPATPATPGYLDKSEMVENLTVHIRSAATMLAQLNSKNLPRADAQAIQSRILAEMSTLEEQRMALSIATDDSDTSIERTMVDKEDPSAAVFAEDWEAKRERIRRGSSWGRLPGWELYSVIVKSDAEMEAAGTQLILGLKRIWEKEGVEVWLRSNGYGLIETITGAMSIHSIKKALTTTTLDENGRQRIKYGTLKDHFSQKFGGDKSTTYTTAQLNFIRSLAGYSMATYILNLKDRHNGNILVDERGHIVHIDFGFFLSNSPGHGMGFEASPFKLTQDYLSIIGGHFPLFVSLLKEAFLAARRHVDDLCVLVEILQRDSKLPAFQLGEGTLTALKARLKLELRDKEAESWVDQLVEKSRGSAWTRGYDLYQALVHGIRP